ncbi:HET-domain-containing protein [Plenodomus tracheiphilus IPT5]|uniref:HET-domain-containing protein n=1 Tax=Plenodomus tracheiphilus IPT5 TaxID=1408161 RepID=A0A6A7B5D1_9PLEO|nr:HET-domain-containing protein [Plenodomus tracheiphilus IPT5]
MTNITSSSASQVSKGKRRADSPDNGSGEGSSSCKRHRYSINTGEPLCSTCQTLDLDASFDEARRCFKWMKSSPHAPSKAVHETRNGLYFYNDGFPVHHFGRRLSRPINCPLCTFFASIRVQPDRYERHKLLAFRTSDHWLFHAERLKEMQSEGEPLEHYVDTVFMAVVPDIEALPPSAYEVSWLDHEIPEVGAIFYQPVHEPDSADTNNLLSAKVMDDEYDLGYVRNWLNACRTEHGDACKQRVSQEPIIKGFRLIDCTKEVPEVVGKPWGTPYAALSYVWGSTPADLVDWPKTILDAISVTNKLGMPYLWVDRLCINQSDPTEKTYLVSKMTAIYEEADFTIIAAAGTGASHGLPGVNSTPRCPQPKYHLNSGSLLLSILPDPRRELLKSPYWTRGWTYQEGVLSNRHITFTPHQTYYECRCMAVQESAFHALFHSSSSPSTPQISIMSNFLLSGIFKASAFSGGSLAHRDDFVISVDEKHRIDYGFPLTNEADITLGARLRGLNEHIREFSKRRLTNDGDSLHAFQGVLGMYAAAASSLYLFHGIPLWMGGIRGSNGGARVTFALSVASWYHGASVDHEMFIANACVRRRHLPSWSWAGWSGTVTWRAPPDLEHCAYMSDLVKAVEPSLVWAASLYLLCPGRETALRLMGGRSAELLKTNQEVFREIEVRDPFVLDRFSRVKDTKREWSWQKRVGRAGSSKLVAHTTTTAAGAQQEQAWYRIGGRLAFIGMSIDISEEEWTRQHEKGELVSVLMFVGRYCDGEHGTARFLTVRRVAGTEGRWERVGTLYLIVPFVGWCRQVEGLFSKVPASRGGESIIIQ